MQKWFNWIAVIVILLLAYFVYTQSRKIKDLTPVVDPPGTTQDGTERSGGEIWDTLRSSAEKMTIDLNFK